MKYNKNQIKAHSLCTKRNSSGFSFGFKARKIIYLMNFCCCSEFQKKRKTQSLKRQFTKSVDLKAVVVKRSKSKESQNYSARASNIHKINRNQFYSRIKSRILHVQHFLFKYAHGNYCMQKCQCVTCFICMKKLCSYRQSSAPLCVHPTTTALCVRGEGNSTALCA